MEEKKTVLITVSYLIDLPGDEIKNDDRLIDRISNDLCKGIASEHTGSILEWGQTATRILDPSTMNCGRCASCGAWTSDQEKENPINSLQVGATVDGKLLCDECLPKGHPLAF